MSAPETPAPDEPFEWIIETHFSKKAPGTEHVARLSLVGTVGSDDPGAAVALQPWLAEKDVPPEELTVELARAYLAELRQAFSPRTQQNRALYAAKAYELLVRRDVAGFEYNPIAKVLEDHPNLLDAVTKKPTPIYRKDVLKDVIEAQHPVDMTVSMTMIKTARRVGGVVNLDFYDVHLAHPAAEWPVHQHIRDKPDHIHFPPGVSQGETFRGEVRPDGMKTTTRVAVPIDNELKAFLVWYLSFRRASDHDGAVFINPRGVQEAERLKSAAYRDWLTPIVKRQGMYHQARDPANIRPQYWRHWTTSKMKDRVHAGTVEYFRGDTASSKDECVRYTDRKARRWRNNIPKFYEAFK